MRLTRHSTIANVRRRNSIAGVNSVLQNEASPKTSISLTDHLPNLRSDRHDTDGDTDEEEEDGEGRPGSGSRGKAGKGRQQHLERLVGRGFTQAASAAGRRQSVKRPLDLNRSLTMHRRHVSVVGNSPRYQTPPSQDVTEGQTPSSETQSVTTARGTTGVEAPRRLSVLVESTGKAGGTRSGFTARLSGNRCAMSWCAS